MTNHTPCYINEHQSDLRSIKAGWYAIDGRGNLPYGPFANRESCLTRIVLYTSWLKSSELRLRSL